MFRTLTRSLLPCFLVSVPLHVAAQQGSEEQPLAFGCALVLVEGADGVDSPIYLAVLIDDSIEQGASRILETYDPRAALPEAGFTRFEYVPESDGQRMAIWAGDLDNFDMLLQTGFDLPDNQNSRLQLRTNDGIALFGGGCIPLRTDDTARDFERLKEMVTP